MSVSVSPRLSISSSHCFFILPRFCLGLGVHAAPGSLLMLTKSLTWSAPDAVDGRKRPRQAPPKPTVTFSQCFGGAFMPLPARKYAELFQKKIERHDVSVYLVNTGWTGGAYGVGKRMDITATRQIVSSILDGSIKSSEFSAPDKHFQLSFPLTLKGVEPSVLDPSQAWADKAAFEETCTKLASMFKANFRKYEKDEFMAKVASVGPGHDALLQ